MDDLRFNGSVWCNIDVALHNLETVYQQELEQLGLNVVEWYIMRLLYDEDGQMASRLADGVGRPATSFTPILDKLQNKGFIERRIHPADRRAIKVYLTKQGRALEEQVKASVERIESKLRKQSKDKDWQGFQKVLLILQQMKTQIG